MRKILLIEPGYKNKYPPIGLMKIATYHRLLGDEVAFYKGNPRDLVLDTITRECVKKLSEVTSFRPWERDFSQLRKCIRSGKFQTLDLEDLDSSTVELCRLWLNHYSQYFRRREYASYPAYDRIYVTTLFTFHWNVTIKAIQESKLLVKRIDELKVGGILASLLPGELESATGIRPLTGLLDKAGVLDSNDLVIDDLPLDYSILEEIDYEYPTGSAYFTFMTKGCTRTCSFCSVPKLEPTYRDKVPTLDKFDEIKNRFGEQQHLLLMDNNVLASPRFPEIIQEIKSMGFVRGARYVEPNQLNLAVANLREGYNDTAYIRRSVKLLHAFLRTRVKGTMGESVRTILESHKLDRLDSATKSNVLAAYEELIDIYEKYRNKSSKQRYVDFNQGTDARYVTEENMKLLSEIPIFPLRIAFDHISLKPTYIKAVRLAAKYGIRRLSNYLLFNFKDKPLDLYRRMRINVDLSEELQIEIYSFPMKYIPLFGEEAKHRRFIGTHWNRKFLRAIQSVSNATRGIVPAGKDFFDRAYGASETEFSSLLYMPEQYILFRKRYDELGLTKRWRDLFENLTQKQMSEALPLIERNDFSDLGRISSNKAIRELLSHYGEPNKDLTKIDVEYLETKARFDELIEADRFIDLTLTYDYDHAVV